MARTKKGETLSLKLTDGFTAYQVDDILNEKEEVYKAIPSIYKEYQSVLKLSDTQLDDKLISPAGAYSIRNKDGALVGAVFYEEGILKGFHATSKDVVPAVMEFCEKRGENVNAYVLRRSTIGNKTGFRVQEFCELLGALVVSKQGHKVDWTNLK